MVEKQAKSKVEEAPQKPATKKAEEKTLFTEAFPAKVEEVIGRTGARKR